jgi:hypothetical protein
MKKRYSGHDKPMDEAVLHNTLKRNDPITPPSQASLNALEIDIFAKIDEQTRDPAQENSISGQIPLWLISQGWTMRAAVFASVLIIASGFIVGQISFAEVDTPAIIATPSLLALSDEAVLQSIPTTDASWGDNNEDTQ